MLIAQANEFFRLVTRKGAAYLMRMMEDFVYIYERSRATVLAPHQYTEVKGKNYILDCLKRQKPNVEFLCKTFSQLDYVQHSITRWTEYLEKNYVENAGLLGPPSSLTINDADELLEECRKWIDTIVSCFENSGLKLLKEDTINKLIPDETMDKLEDDAKKDLKDSIDCLIHLFPTASAMLTVRVAERVLRKFYKKTTERNPGDRGWGKMINELEDSKKVDASIMGYLKYLNQKRIDTAHPYKRYNQDESERMLLKLKDLLEEIPP